MAQIRSERSENKNSTVLWCKERSRKKYNNGCGGGEQWWYWVLVVLVLGDAAGVDAEARQGKECGMRKIRGWFCVSSLVQPVSVQCNHRTPSTLLES